MSVFVAFPFTTYDGSMEDLLGVEKAQKNTMTQTVKIDITQIEAYEQAIPLTEEFDEDNLISTEVFMRSGSSHLVAMPMEEFEAMLTKWMPRLH